MERVPITAAGFADLEKELKILKAVERPSIIQAISEARELGDLSENAEYQTAREKQSFIEGRILELGDKISRAEVIDISKLSGNTVKFGATVKLIDEDTDKEVTYMIVGETESDIKNGRVSVTSPIARAIIGRELGDSVEVNTPSGIKSYEIESIEFI